MIVPVGAGSQRAMPKITYHDSSGAESSIELGAEPVLIGRAPECQIQTQDGLVSRRHARVVVQEGLYWIEDMQSANGVYVNSQRIQKTQLRPGDEMVCGSLTMRFVADVAAAVRRTQGMAAYVDPPSSGTQPPRSQPEPGSAELSALRAEVDSERRRRTEAEFDRDEALRRVKELGEQLAAPSADGDEFLRLRRRNEQLESELRRSRGGQAPAASGDALRAAEAERDQLKARLVAFEAQTASRPPIDEMEHIRLQRRVDQLQSELRRTRAGADAPSAGADGARTNDLEEKVRRLEQERDDALRRAAAAPPEVAPDTQVAEELMRARRQLDQLQSELRRIRAGGGAPADAPPGADLETALRQLRDVERERDSLRALVAAGPIGKARPPTRALELLGLVSDGLADIRGALRATGDEVAIEQLEQLRGQLRDASELLGT